MQKEELNRLFNEFIVNYDVDAHLAIWYEKSEQFRKFWAERILNKDEKILNEVEVDQIIRILDRNAKGNTKKDEAVAKAMIAQGVWRRMFNEIKQRKELQEVLTKIFKAENDNILIQNLNELYKINEGHKNNLTGKSGNAINSMLFAYAPDRFVSIISLNDRKKAIEYFNFPNKIDFENDSQGKKLVESNRAIIDGFKGLGLDVKPRVFCDFLYGPFREYWKGEPVEEKNIPEDDSKYLPPQESADPSLFYMEKELENFLIKNWDKTELGKEFELIAEDGELVSQQYPTDIGKIDILARDKKTKQYVIIELKRNQTSDDTVGQLTRYMGWVEEKLSKGKPSKGIIIAAQYDERLYYALKKIKDVEVFLYRIDFKLHEFTK